MRLPPGRIPLTLLAMPASCALRAQDPLLPLVRPRGPSGLVAPRLIPDGPWHGRIAPERWAAAAADPAAVAVPH